MARHATAGTEYICMDAQQGGPGEVGSPVGGGFSAGKAGSEEGLGTERRPSYSGAHGPLHSRAVPPERLSGPRGCGRRTLPQRWPEDTWGGEGGHSVPAGDPTHEQLPCLTGCLPAPGGLRVRAAGPPSGAGAVSHRAPASICPLLELEPAIVVTEARGPFGPRHRWSLWVVGRWPSLTPRFPGGAAPR